MLSLYMDNEITAGVKVYAINQGEFLAFRFTIDLRNNADFELDFVINFTVRGAKPVGSARAAQKSVSRIPPGSTRTLEVVLDKGEDCRNVTVEEVALRAPARGYHRRVPMPSPTIWDLATSNYWSRP